MAVSPWSISMRPWCDVLALSFVGEFKIGKDTPLAVLLNPVAEDGKVKNRKNFAEMARAVLFFQIMFACAQLVITHHQIIRNCTCASPNLKFIGIIVKLNIEKD